MHLLVDPAAWASLVTLAALEVVLGIDNIVVLSIMTRKLRAREARRARGIGLLLALGFRVLLLLLITRITELTEPVITIFAHPFSWRDAILIGGGLFLIVKAIEEIHAEIEGREAVAHAKGAPSASFATAVLQIALMDLVFSLDSIITAVGMARDVRIMIAAIFIAIIIMYFAAGVTGAFLKRHPTTTMLALCFLILIGVVLLADGAGFTIPRGYIYFAIGFAAVVEAFNVRARSLRARRGHAADGRAEPAASAPPERITAAEKRARNPRGRKHRVKGSSSQRRTRQK